MLKLGLTDLKEDKFKGYPTEELFAILTLAIIGDAYVNHKDNKGKKRVADMIVRHFGV